LPPTPLRQIYKHLADKETKKKNNQREKTKTTHPNKLQINHNKQTSKYTQFLVDCRLLETGEGYEFS